MSGEENGQVVVGWLPMGGGAQEQDGQGHVVEVVSTAPGHRLDRVDLVALVAPGDAAEGLEL